MAGMVTATGLLGAGGWSSALALVLRGLGGFGGQEFLVLPPFSVPPLFRGGSLLLPRGRTAVAALQRTLVPWFSELLSDHVLHRDVDRSARRVLVGVLIILNPVGAQPFAGPVRASPDSSAYVAGAVAYPSTRSQFPLPAGSRRPYPRGARSSQACRLHTGGCCGGSAAPTPAHAVGTRHGGGAAATSCPPPASSPSALVPLDGLVLGVAVEPVVALHSIYRAGTQTPDGGCGGGRCSWECSRYWSAEGTR